MRWSLMGFGGERASPEFVKRSGWRDQKILVVNADDDRLTWPEREFIRQIGERLYGLQRSEEAGRA